MPQAIQPHFTNTNVKIQPHYIIKHGIHQHVITISYPPSMSQMIYLTSIAHHHPTHNVNIYLPKSLKWVVVQIIKTAINKEQ